MSPSSPDLILQVCSPSPLLQAQPFTNASQPKQEQSAVPSHLIQGIQSVEDADLWCIPQSLTTPLTPSPPKSPHINTQNADQEFASDAN
jgi:hypothetical protein